VTATVAQVRKLARPTPHDRVEWLAGRATHDKSRISVMPYADSRYVMDTLDEIVGPENWQDRFEDAIGGYRGGIGIQVDGEWIWKYDAAPATDIEPVKGGHSNALKRAGVHWGIGRDLYDYPDLWVPAVETYNGSGKYKPASLPEWDGSQWITSAGSSSTRQSGNGRAAGPPPAARPPARTTTDMPEFPDDFGEESVNADLRRGGNPPTGSGWSFKELAEATEAAGLPKNKIYQTADQLFGKDTKVTSLTGPQREQIAFEMGLVG
jgi:hypothetical protein